MNRVFALTGLASAIALGGCVSTNHVLAHEVDEVLHTPASPAMVSACFMHRMHIRTIERLDGARVVSIKGAYGGTIRTFSIFPEGTGSRIEVRHGALSGPVHRWKRCVGLEPMRPGDTGEDAG